MVGVDEGDPPSLLRQSTVIAYAQVDSLALPDGRLVLAFNDDAKQRTKLTLATTGDGGKTWERQIVLEDDPQGSFSYPTLQFLPDQAGLL